MKGKVQICFLNLFSLILYSFIVVNMPGTLNKAKKKIESGAEKTEAESKKVGGDIKKAGIKVGEEAKKVGKKSADEVKKVGHETKEKLHPKKA